MRRLAKHPTENKLLRSEAGKLVVCGCDDCTYFAAPLLANHCLEVTISGVESTGVCSDCASVNGTYYAATSDATPDDHPTLCGFRWYGSAILALPCNDAAWVVDAEFNSHHFDQHDHPATQAVVQVEIAALVGEDVYVDSALFGYVDWDYYYGGDKPSDPFYAVDPTAAARDVIERLCNGETVELPFVILDPNHPDFLYGVCDYSNAQVSVRVVPDSNCPSIVEEIRCADEAYVEITFYPDCTYNWQVVSPSGCECSGVEFVVTEDMVCVEITCADGSTRIACTSFDCGEPEPGNCAQGVRIQTWCAGGVTPRWSVTMSPGCSCTVQAVHGLDIANFTGPLVFEISCTDGSSATKTVRNPCTNNEDGPCSSHHWESNPFPPPDYIRVPDWDHDCPCLGAFDDLLGQYVSQKRDFKLVYNNPLPRCVSFDGSLGDGRLYDVDVSLLNGTWILRDNVSDGCTMWRELSLAGYRVEGRTCDGIPVCLETRRTLHNTTDVLGRPITYCTHVFYEYFVESINVAVQDDDVVAVVFLVNRYIVGQDLFAPDLSGTAPQFQNCDTWPEATRFSCTFDGQDEGTKIIDMVDGDRLVFDANQFKFRCGAPPYCWTAVFDDMGTEELPLWAQGALSCVLGQGKVIESCVSLICAA